MYWANFLHIYQPPTQKPYWVKRVAHESYIKLVDGLKRHPKARITLNINAVLTELLVANGFSKLVHDLRRLAERGQIELTASAKYHPLLPKLPDKEIIRQIKLNTVTNRKYFGKAWKPKGFFPPEMAFSTKVARIARQMGYAWTVVDELSFPSLQGVPQSSTIYTVKGLGDFSIFFRERNFSFKVLSAQLGTGPMLLRELGPRRETNSYLLTGMDGETFGHHRPGLETLLYELWRSQALPTCTISELFNLFPKREAIMPLPATWALMPKDREQSIPFARWDDPDNPIHAMQWELTALAIKAIGRLSPKRLGFQRARKLVDRAIHSDQYWWASARPWWSLEMIEAGARELRDAVLATPGTTTKEKERARKLYEQIIELGFTWQRNGRVETLAREEDEEIRQRMGAGTDRPFLTKQDFLQMIKMLTQQMLTAAQAKEFERAIQLRDRIREIREEHSRVSRKRTHTHSHEDDWGV